MRLGVVADVHGNVAALEAVVADAADLGVDSWWALGDLVLFGPRPVETLELLLTLPGIELVQGNTDRYVLTGEQPEPHATAADASRAPALVERYGQMAAGIGWTRGALSQGGLLEQLTFLPPAVRTVLPDGTRALGVHASPASDDGPGIDCQTPDHDMAALVADCDADIVVGGHTHEPTDRMVGNIRVLNGGSVGLPRRAAGAGWLLMEADGAGVDVHHRVVAFDVEAVIEDLWGRRHPNASFVESILRRRHAFAR